jgi:hypothetical protein
MRSLRGFSSTLALALPLLVSACQLHTPPAPEPVGPQFLEHRIAHRGETLGLIARWYTGSADNWKRLVDANPGLRVNSLQLGQVVLIPEEIVTRSEPLPASMLKSAPNRSRQEAAPSNVATKGSASHAEKRASGPDSTGSVQDESAAPQAGQSTDSAKRDSAVAVPTDTAKSVSAKDGATPSTAPLDHAVPELTDEIEPLAEPRPSVEVKSRDELLRELLR